MKRTLLLLSFLISFGLDAATIKTIKGNRASLKLTAQELESVETDMSYDLVSNGASVGRIKVSKIFPGKGIQGTLESKTNGLKTTSSVKLSKVDAETSDTETEATDATKEETGIRPTSGQPEVKIMPIGFQFGLLLGTHTLTSKDSEGSVYASNFSLRAIYKFPAIPLGIGGHLKNNAITRKMSDDSGQAELEMNFTSLGMSLALVHDFGNFRPYALYEISSGNFTFKAKAKDPVFGETQYESDPERYVGNTAMVGGSYLLGNFSIGLEYQAFGQMTYKTSELTDGFEEKESTATLNSTGFSVHLGWSI